MINTPYYSLKSAAESAIANVDDAATRDALTAILEVAKIYPESVQTTSRQG